MSAVRRIAATLAVAWLATAPAFAAPPAPVGPPAGPRVFSFVVTPTDVGSFAKVSGTVHASPDVKVVAVSVGHLKPEHLTQTAPGTFEGTIRLPWVPFFLHGTYVVTATGYDLLGHQASSTASVNVHW